MAKTVTQHASGIWRQVRASGSDPNEVAATVVQTFRGGEFAACIVISRSMAAIEATASALVASNIPVGHLVGGSVVELLTPEPDVPTSDVTVEVVGFERNWCRVAVGVVDSKAGPIAASHAAIEVAARALSRSLDSSHNDLVAVTLFDGTSGQEESFCLGTAMGANRLPIVGGALALPRFLRPHRARIWYRGWQNQALGLVLLIESKRRFATISGSHMEATPIATVVTSCAGKKISELDGKPAIEQIGRLVKQIANDAADPTEYALGWYSRGMPYLRSIISIEEDHLLMAGTVLRGQVLRLMQPTDIVAATSRVLDAAVSQIGKVEACLAFSCVERERFSRTHHTKEQLASTYQRVPCFGFESLGEQSGMMLVNHTLTGLAIGARNE